MLTDEQLQAIELRREATTSRQGHEVKWGHWERKKCYVQDDIIMPCKLLDKALEGVSLSKRAGLSLLVLSNGETGKTGILLRSGDYHREGVIINYCPFCGTPIADQFVLEEEANENQPV